MLLGSPEAGTALAVPVIKASCVRELACGVPGQVRVADFELAERKAPEPAELPVRGELDFVQQAGAAGLAGPVCDIAQ
jgi:hypothetical protein